VTAIETDLSIRNLSFSYPEYPGVAARKLFDGLDLQLPSGNIAVVLARPDQGKTTLCRVLSGLIPRFSGGEVEGEARLGSVDLLGQDPYQLIDQVGMVFQHPGEQLLTSRCDAEIAFALESLGLSRSEIQQRVNQALEVMNLARYRFQSPKVLSGGEKKKLLIACLLAVDPRLWLLDETLEELDGDTKSQLLKLLKERGRSTLILSAKWHDIFEDAAGLVFLMEEGQVRPVGEKPGSVDFHRLLLTRGFVLPEEQPAPEHPSSHATASSTPALSTPASSVQAASAGAETLLEARDLFFRYGEEGGEAASAFALHIDRLRLSPGEILAVVGDNGSGKSTLGRLLCGLLTPGGGEIRIRRRGVLQPAAARELNRFTGYLFQDPDLQIFLPTVFEELALGLRRQHLSREEISLRVRKTIALFGLPAGEAPPSLMSYGARKKLQAAVYYMLARPLMIIDEGDSGLSVDDFTRVVDLFRKEDGTVIFITHDFRLARALADEVLELKAGRFA
jgi:energy-coupling factor transport system ATP-binding protein